MDLCKEASTGFVNPDTIMLFFICGIPDASNGYFAPESRHEIACGLRPRSSAVETYYALDRSKGSGWEKCGESRRRTSSLDTG